MGKAVSDPDKIPPKADSPKNPVDTSEKSLSKPETGVEGSSSQAAATAAKIDEESAASDQPRDTLSLQRKTRAHDQEIEQLKERIREHDARLEAATRILSGMRAPERTTASTGLPQPKASPTAAPIEPEENLASADVRNPLPSAAPSGARPDESSATPPAGEQSPNHGELEKLKERLREQDARLDATTQLLSSIRLVDAAATRPTQKQSVRAPQLAVLGAAGALVIIAGFLYVRSQAAHPVEGNQTVALAQPQAAAGASSAA